MPEKGSEADSGYGAVITHDGDFKHRIGRRICGRRYFLLVAVRIAACPRICRFYCRSLLKSLSGLGIGLPMEIATDGF